MFEISELKQDGFGWSKAIALALASKLAYRPEHEIKSTCVSAWGFESCDFVSVSDTQFFVASTEDIVLLSFRGSVDLADWVNNMKILQSRLDTGGTQKGRIHYGFLDEYNKAKSQLLSLLTSHGFQNKKLWVTGHSLGGALATIFLADQYGQLEFSGCHTFGQPRTGDRDFQVFVGESLIAKKMFRFVNNNDIVTRIPPSFQHVGQLVYFDRDGETSFGVPDDTGLQGIAIQELGGMSEDAFEELQQKCKLLGQATGLEGVISSFLQSVIPGASAHSIENYINLAQSKI